MLKYKIYVFLLLILFLTSASIVKASSFPLLGRVIYIDPGHGGRDPGALYKNIEEEDINLEISLKLRDLLERNGAVVYMTREGDYDLSINDSMRKRSDLSNRVSMINNCNPDLYLSIHLNSETTSSWRGAQVFYDDVNEKNKIFAEIMQQEFRNELKSKRKISEIKTIYLNKNVKVPGLLLEVGFLSNPNERYMLRKEEYQNKINNTILKGIIKYLNN